MALGPRLDLRQSQSLVMTPQLQQAIKLLALSNLEIEAFIAEEVERNPLLEAEREDRADADGDSGGDDFDAVLADLACELAGSGNAISMLRRARELGAASGVALQRQLAAFTVVLLLGAVCLMISTLTMLEFRSSSVTRGAVRPLS